jgi:hypothetical protein
MIKLIDILNEIKVNDPRNKLSQLKSGDKFIIFADEEYLRDNFNEEDIPELKKQWENYIYTFDEKEGNTFYYEEGVNKFGTNDDLKIKVVK